VTLKRALESGLVLGASWGFVEVVLTYVTGFAPTRDVVEIALAPLLVLVLYEATVLAVAQVRPHPFFDLVSVASVVLPPAILFWRGRSHLVPEHLAAGLVPIALCLALVYLETKRPTEPRWLTPGRLPSILLIYFGASVAFAIRGDRVLAITSLMLATSLMWCASVAALGAVILALARKRSVGAVLLLLAASAFAIAWQRG